MMKRRLLAVLAVIAMMIGLMPSAALAYEYPSTNDANRDADLPHVDLVSNDFGEVTLEFVNETNSLAFFEYRIDGQVLTDGTAHPVVTDDFIYPGVSVDGRDNPEPVIEERTFEADETVEVRLALGGERDWDFDWVTFDVLTKDDCKDGGWEGLDYNNQGECVQDAVTG